MPTASHLHGRSTLSLLNSLLVFRLCRVKPLVRNARRILSAFDAFPGGTLLTGAVIRRTFFRQFVGGESELDLSPVVEGLYRQGVGSILDYAAEADESPSSSPSSSPSNLCLGEASLLINLGAVAAAAKTGGFAAVKITGMGNPALLKEVTQRMMEHLQGFQGYFEEGPSTSLPTPQMVLTADSFTATLRSAHPALSLDSIHRLYALLDVRGTGRVDYIEFSDVCRLVAFGGATFRECAGRATGLPVDDILPILLLRKTQSIAPIGSLTLGQREEWGALMARTTRLCTAAQTSGVSLMLDAEQSYLQLAIDLATMTCQRRFNRPGGGGSYPLPEETHFEALLASSGGGGGGISSSSRHPPSTASHLPLPPFKIPVFNTYQAYAKDCPFRVGWTIARAEREGWALGVKLVRGAYMNQERSRAAEKGYPDPIWEDIGLTHKSYAQCLDCLMDMAEKRGGAFMVASHNVESCETVARRVEGRVAGAGGAAAATTTTTTTVSERLAQGREPGGMSAGQLLGMSDGLTFHLASRGLPVYKYLPFGPVHSVLPYLLRRAEENSDLLTSNVGKEIQDLERELWTRAGFK